MVHSIVGYLSANAKSLVRALLDKDPLRRLGSGLKGTAAIKAHPFFRGINWSQLEARQVWILSLCQGLRIE